MKKYFYIDPNNRKRGIMTYSTKIERDLELLKYIDSEYLIDGIYDDDLICDIFIGILTHELAYKSEWNYSVGKYTICTIN